MIQTCRTAVLHIFTLSLFSFGFSCGQTPQGDAAKSEVIVERIFGPQEAAKSGKTWLKGQVMMLSPKGTFAQGVGFSGRPLATTNDGGNFWTWSEKNGFAWGAVVKNGDPQAHPELFGVTMAQQKRVANWNRKYASDATVGIHAYSVSEDGKVAVGERKVEGSETPWNAFVWREDTGFKDLSQAAPIPAAIDTKFRYYHWKPRLSDDGTTIITGMEELWRIHDSKRFASSQ